MKLKILPSFILLLAVANFAFAQTTEFTYQGRLLDGSMPPTASYDFEFGLFATEAGGTALATNQRSGVSVANGIFTVRLDFAGSFDGAPRWLEIAVKPAGSPDPFTPLNPRQPITSAPYAIRALNSTTAETSVNADNLGGIAANQYVQTGDTRLSDDRNPLPGSANYIQNTLNPQTSSNFNISGTGAAGIFNAVTQYNINGSRVLFAPGSGNLFVGRNTGTANTSGNSNSFFGDQAGASNTSGNSNAFFGERAGTNNTNGFANSFFGATAGVSNTGGRTNSFFGTSAGFSNNNGNDNSFFGVQAGFTNVTGDQNSFFGRGAGFSNTASNNAFFGYNAGNANTSAQNNSFFGSQAGQLNTTGGNNAFFGFLAGGGNTTGQFNAFFGSGAGGSNSASNDNSFFGYSAGSGTTTGSGNTFIGQGTGSDNNTGNNNTAVGAGANVGAGNLSFATAIGAGVSVGASNTVRIGRFSDTVRITGNLVAELNLSVTGNVSFLSLGSAGNTDLCRNASNQISTCSSSLRYKSNVNPFSGGLNIVRQLRPITFDWLNGGMNDVGFAAEEVEKIEPRLVTYRNGRIEGVKYAQITTVLVNAVNEQQEIIREQQKQIDALRQIVCEMKPEAAICKKKDEQR